MSDIRDFFIKTLDEAESGINGMMLRFYRKIKSMDAKVEARLVDQDIKPQYFSFRYVGEPKTFGKIKTANAIFWIYLGATA